MKIATRKCQRDFSTQKSLNNAVQIMVGKQSGNLEAAGVKAVLYH
jgi:hypothetical protein